MPTHINGQSVKTLKPTSTPREIRDTEVHGFIYRVNAAKRDGTARRGYYVEYGRGKRLKIGDGALLTPKRARNLARAVLGAVAEGRDPAKALNEARNPDGAELTLREFLSDAENGTEQRYGYWVKVQRKTGPATLKRLRACFKSVEHLTLGELGPAVIDRWRTNRMQLVKAETVNRDLAALRAALGKAVEWGYLPSHPLESFKPLKTDKRKKTQRALTTDEEKRLIQALNAREEKKRTERESANEWRRRRRKTEYRSLDGRYVDHLTPAVLLSLNTGLRRGELFALTWKDVDLDRGILTVRGETAKSGHTRRIELNKTALAILRRWKLQTGGSGMVFAGRAGNLKNLKKSYGAVLEAAKIARDGSVTWHSLRHTFGTRLAAAGVPPHTVQALMGHADLQTTMRYFHVTEDERRSAVDRLNSPGVVRV